MPTLEEIKQMIFQLPIQEQIILMEDLEEKLGNLSRDLSIKVQKALKIALNLV